jgi:hypothetical protein
MHRSGTSALTRVFNLLGADLPKNLDNYEPQNKEGHWESSDLIAIHNDLLQTAGSRWDDWRAFNPDWMKSGVAEDYRKRLLDILKSDFAGSRMFVVKEPRICRFVPLWLDLLEEFGAVSSIVMPIRNPLEVAASLMRRDGLPLAKSLLLWLRHVLDAEQATRHLPRAIVTYKSLLNDWRGVVATVAAKNRLRWPRRSDHAEVEIDRFITETLRHQIVDDRQLAARADIVDWVNDVYANLINLPTNTLKSAALTRLDGIRSEFNKASSAFGVALAEGEAELARRGAEISQFSTDLSALRDATGELKKERDVLTISLAGEREASAKLRAEVSELHAVSAKRQSELEKLSEEFRAAQAALRNRESEVDKLSSDLEATRSLLRNSQSENQRLGGQLDGAKTAFAEVERRRLVASLVAETGEREHAKTKLDEAAAERLKLSEALKGQSEELQALKRRVDELQQERDAFSRNAALLPALRVQLGAIQEALADAHRDTDCRERRIGDLINDLQSITKERDRLRTLEEQLQEESREKDRLAGELEIVNEDARQNEKNLGDRIAALETLRESALAEGERRGQARVRTLQEKLVEAEATAAKFAVGRRKGASWARRFSPVRRRVLRRLTVSGLFDADWYTREYPDVAASGLSPVEHYLEEGYIRGYRPNPLFDTRWYLERYEDVRRAGVNPLVHYLHNGCREGRDPSPHFHTDFYLTTNPDVRASGVNPLSHYLRYGRNEGRVPTRP